MTELSDLEKELPLAVLDDRYYYMVASPDQMPEIGMYVFLLNRRYEQAEKRKAKRARREERNRNKGK